MIHTNSLLAWGMVQKSKADRYQAILLTLEEIGEGTDRQICGLLHFQDMNAVRPRITELIDNGVLREVGSIIDPETKRKVRKVAVA